jgi:hypothetical protein
MMADTDAVIGQCPTPNHREEFCFAGGKPAAQLYNGIRPLGWSDHNNTPEDWVEWFDTLEEAEKAFEEAKEALFPPEEPQWGRVV